MRQLTRIEQEVAVAVLHLAAEEFSNHSSNGFELPYDADHLQFAKDVIAAHGVDDGEPYIADGVITIHDHEVMRYIADLLSADFNDRSHPEVDDQKSLRTLVAIMRESIEEILRHLGNDLLTDSNLRHVLSQTCYQALKRVPSGHWPARMTAYIDRIEHERALYKSLFDVLEQYEQTEKLHYKVREVLGIIRPEER